MAATPRDHRLIDWIEPQPSTSATLTVWRVCAEGRDPCACGRPMGRWDDGTFNVLYTAEEADGAVAEMFFHLRRGQPVFPSKVRFALSELEIRFHRLLDVSDPAMLVELGVDLAQFGQLSYGRHRGEYPRTQEIGEVARFLDFDGLRIPNARWACANIVVFCDALAPGGLAVRRDHGLVDWADWQSRRGRRPAGLRRQ